MTLKSIPTNKRLFSLAKQLGQGQPSKTKILDNKWSTPIRYLEKTLVSSLPMPTNVKSPDFHSQQVAVSCQRRLGGQSGLHYHPVMEFTNKNKLIENI